jgi:spore coat polysaccharide biosynthesis protein SpsF
MVVVNQHTVAIIQGRMGSTRLPGKIMFPLRTDPVLIHDIQRVNTAELVDDTVVATSNKTADDIVARYSRRGGADVFRGSESDVLDRMFKAAKRVDADVVVRITSDCPLISPETIDTVTDQLIKTNADYSANILDRTFPRGLDVEAFTFESFKQVHGEATDPAHREHVTPYYREHPEQFELVNVTSDQVFDKSWMQDRTDLRLTLDEADDYEVLRKIYENVPYEGTLDIRDAVRYVDEHDLMALNADVSQKST